MNKQPEQPSTPSEQPEVVLDLTPKQMPIKLRGQDGEVTTYTVRDITGDERDQYLDMQMAKVRYSADGTPMGLKTMAGIQARLLSLSLHDAEGNRVAEALIRNFPSSVQTYLFTKAKEICGLDDMAKERAKNA